MLDNLRENFALIITVTLCISTLAHLIYRLTFYKHIKKELADNAVQLAELKRKPRKTLRNNIIYSHIDTVWRKSIFFFADMFWPLLLIFILRSFLYEPFIIPSGSMKPGMLVGDVILVNKFDKGLRMPITDTRLTEGNPLERGDAIVFRYPKNPQQAYIKRVVGLPGDSVVYDNRRLIVNNQVINLQRGETITEIVSEWDAKQQQPVEYSLPSSIYTETQGEKSYPIQYVDSLGAKQPRQWKVPQGKYLVFGDNRDNSADSRVWGYVDDSLVIGHATRVLLNFNCFMLRGHCDRFFKTLK